MRKMSLDETYKGVVLIDMFEQEKQELEIFKNHILSEFLVGKDALSKIAVISFCVSTVLFFLINLTYEWNFYLFFKFPLFTLMGSVFTIAIVIPLWFYNKAVKTINIQRKKNDKDMLYYQQNKIAIEENQKTVKNTLKEKSSVAVRYHRKEVLEVMINYMRTGRSLDTSHASLLVEKEYPHYFRG